MDVIDQLVKNDSNTKQSTILMKPRHVNKGNEAEVWTTLFGAMPEVERTKYNDITERIRRIERKR